MVDVEVETVKFNAENFRRALSSIGVGLKITPDKTGVLGCLMYRHDGSSEPVGIRLIIEK